MIEESPEGFIQRWRGHAARVELFARPEGSPLLECRAGPAILQVLERTGPYRARPGAARLILNAVVDRLEPVDDGDGGGADGLEVLGLSRVRATGVVVAAEDGAVVVDCGVPLVVTPLERAAPPPRAGQRVQFESLPPIHAFLVPEEGARRRRDESPDEVL